MPMERKKPIDPGYEEEQRLRDEFIASLKKKGWKKHQIEAAEGGWEYSFDVGFDRPEADSDAAYDLAEGLMDDTAWRRSKASRDAIADYVYDGCCAARKAQGL